MVRNLVGKDFKMAHVHILIHQDPVAKLVGVGEYAGARGSGAEFVDEVIKYNPEKKREPKKKEKKTKKKK